MRRSRPATCHPERPRKTSNGECDRCYARRLYAENPEYRERKKARSRDDWHREKRVLTDAQKARKLELRRIRYAADPRPQQSAVLRGKFGITLDDYDEMLARQGGACLICQTNLTNLNKRAPVDHDHSTGAIRGIICHPCNAGLGHFADEPARLRAAAEYLEQRRP